MAEQGLDGAKPGPREAAPGKPGLSEVSEVSEVFEVPAAPEVPGVPRVVGVGASAGGLEALSRFLRALPADTGLAFVLVQHLAARRESLLAEILSKATAMPVAEVTDGTAVTADHVYVIPPGQDLALVHGVLHITPLGEEHALSRPIDHFLRTLAADQGERAVGVILSGTASDGTLGLEAIKDAGGATFAQDETARQHSMPRSAVAAGCVDRVLPPDAIAAEIAALARGGPRPASPAHAPSDPGLVAILQVLRDVTRVDFTHYKPQTLHRRITRRMALRRSENLSAYARLLARDAAEAEALYQDILISVTGFFRDPELFETLKADVLPALFEQHADGEPLRVWVVGCSTGEEAYSLAIALSEHDAISARRLPIQLFATDLSETSIVKARAGVYSRSATRDVSSERLSRFFEGVDGRHRIGHAIRDMCVFSRHNVLTDPPFSHVDLISCRNLLIYLEPTLQDRLLTQLHHALNPDGVLVLGSSETIGTHRELFHLRDPVRKIYTRKATTGAAIPLPRIAALPTAGREPAVRPAPPEDDGEDGLHAEVSRLVLAKYSPPGVVIDGDLQVLHVRGDTSGFLVPAAGKASLHLLKMAREGLSGALREAIHQARQERLPVRRSGVRLGSGPLARDVSVEVAPLHAGPGGTDRFLVLFIAGPALAEDAAHAAARRGPLRTFLHSAFGAGRHNGRSDDAAADEPDGAPEARGTALARELSVARDHLQAVIEQQDVVNEKLSTANTRAQAANEELQSINEELATSQEEIQASNEELATINDELNDRNLDVSRINSDLANLIGGVQLAIVMLGSDLRVRRFSPQAEQVLGLSPADIGRPLTDVKLAIAIPDAERLLGEVIGTGSARECEVQDGQGRWYAARIRPFRTAENLVDGVVLVLVDIDRIKRARSFAESVVATLREPLLVLDGEFRVRMASRAFYETFRMTPAQTENRLLHELADRQWDIPELRRLLEVVLPRQSFFDGFEVRRDFKDIGTKTMRLNARQLMLGVDEPRMILLAIEDFTKHRQLEDALQLRIDDLARVDRSRTEFLSMLAHELRNPLAAIGSGLAVLSSSRATPDVREHARDLAGRQLRTVVRLTDDLLDVARVTRGRIQLRKERVDLVNVLEQAIELTAPVWRARGQELIRDIPPGPLPVQGDAIRLRQVFINLIENASKYGRDSGHIWISLQPGCADGAVVRVRDDGIGIDAEMLPHIFELFAQADTSLARSQGGLGIGLTLVRSLVEIHEGTVEAASRGIGHGSEFVVRLPCAVAGDPEPPPARPEVVARAAAAPPAPGGAHRILVVDDNMNAAECMAMVLRLDGHDVTLVHDGRAALDTASVLQPSVILLDIGLPGMDGLEVARRLRTQPGVQALIVAVSGYGQEDDRRRTREAGFDHHLTKPVDFATLETLLGAAPRPVGQAAAGSA